MRRDKECILRRGLGQHGTELPAARLSPRNRSFPAFLLAAVAVSVGVWGVLSLVRNARMREIGLDGARWIWVERSPDPRPIHFSAVREFTLGAAPASAEARIFVDRSFQLWINGTRAGTGGQAPGDPVAEFEVGKLLLPGTNVIGIVAESPRGLGGILFSLKVGGGGPSVVSDRSWTVDDSGTRLTGPAGRPATVLGVPPMHPWGWVRAPESR
jgi:hypothetical protein